MSKNQHIGVLKRKLQRQQVLALGGSSTSALHALSVSPLAWEGGHRSGTHELIGVIAAALRPTSARLVA